MCIGDLLGFGMILGLIKDSCGLLFEFSWGGKELLMLDIGEICLFLEDGDILILCGVVYGDGYCIGFGDCIGIICFV